MNNEGKPRNRPRFNDWGGVAEIAKGKEVELHVCVTCRECGNDIPIKWQGKPVGKTLQYPVWQELGYCRHCKEWQEIWLPRMSVLQWMYLAKIEIRKCYRDEQHKYIPENSSSTSSQRKELMTKEEIFARKQAHYAHILQKCEEKEKFKNAS